MSDLCNHARESSDTDCGGVKRSVVCRYSFRKPSNVLGGAEEAALLRKNLTQLLRGVKLSKHFYFLFQGIRLLPLRLSRHMVPAGAKNMGELVVVGSTSL